MLVDFLYFLCRFALMRWTLVADRPILYPGLWMSHVGHAGAHKSVSGSRLPLGSRREPVPAPGLRVSDALCRGGRRPNCRRFKCSCAHFATSGCGGIFPGRSPDSASGRTRFTTRCKSCSDGAWTRSGSDESLSQWGEWRLPPWTLSSEVRALDRVRVYCRPRI